MALQIWKLQLPQAHGTFCLELCMHLCLQVTACSMLQAGSTTQHFVGRLVRPHAPVEVPEDFTKWCSHDAPSGMIWCFALLLLLLPSFFLQLLARVKLCVSRR